MQIIEFRWVRRSDQPLKEELEAVGAAKIKTKIKMTSCRKCLLKKVYSLCTENTLWKFQANQRKTIFLLLVLCAWTQVTILPLCSSCKLPFMFACILFMLNCSRQFYQSAVERRWTIIALRNLIFYFWSNIELTWHECSFMSQITNYKEKMLKKNFWDLI